MSAIRFGITLQGVEPPRAFQEQVRALEGHGFTHLWITDSSLHARYVYSYLTLAALNSTRLRLGTGITHPFTRHPGVTVNAIATIDEISEGRAMLGLGTGDSPTMELGYAPAPVRIVREMIDVARRMMAGETLTYQGSTFELVNAHLHYKLRDRIPIYLACSGPRMLALAGEVADGVIVQVGVFPEAIDYALARIREGAARAGRSLDEIDVWIMLCGSISDEREKATQRSRTMAAWFAQTAPHYCELAGLEPALIARIRAAYSGGEFHQAQAAAALVPDRMVELFTLAGTVGEARERVERLIAHGVTSFNFMPTGAERRASIDLFAREILRPLAGVAPA